MLNDVKYIGMDVHQATISVVVLDSTGHLVMESILETLWKKGVDFDAEYLKQQAA